MTTKNAYDRLTAKQRTVFEVYVTVRSIQATADELDMPSRDVAKVVESKGVTAAVKEHNDQLKDKMIYDESVVIERMWTLAADPETPAAVKAALLRDLGKQIGMFGVNAKAEAELVKARQKTQITYNVVNYANNSAPDAEKAVKEVLPAIEAPVAGIEIKQY